MIRNTPQERRRVILSKPWTIQSLARGLKLLDILATQPGGCSVKWLSSVSGITLGTCYHLINTLIEAGYVEKDETAQTYTLSYKIAYLNNQIHTRLGLPQPLTEKVDELMRLLHETTYLAKWENGEVVVHYIAEGNQAVKVRSLYVGYHEHALLHALGRAVLAYLTPDELDRYWASHEIAARTPFSKGAEGIKQELQFAREEGYAKDQEELEVGLCCLGVPIFRFDGSIWGALAISLPSIRYVPSPDLIVPLKEKAAEVAQRLGYRTPLEQNRG